MQILVIEDEQRLARHICSALYRSGHEVSAEHDGVDALASVLKNQPDLIVLDLNLPSMNGMEILERMQEAKCKSRVIILTASGDIDDRVKGLTAGADDYLAKPFSMDELIARVEALGRRGVAPVAANLLKVADLTMDLLRHKVIRNGKSIALSPREFELLQLLMNEPGRVFTRSEISDRVWQREHEYDTRTVEIFITRLRKKVDAGFEVPLIHTLRAVGYTIKPGIQATA
ncbi:MAG: response regulator transcription factor [Luteolibacter sp.]